MHRFLSAARLFVVAFVTLTPFRVAWAGPDMSAINGLDRAAFVQKFGGIFEKAAWVAEKAWEKKPFTTPAELHAAMVDAVKHAPVQDQIALLQGHPDLAGKEAQAATMTASSTSEQSKAGINALTKDEMARIAALNAAYKKKFGFPFIIAVRLYTKEGIFFEFERRLRNHTVIEYANGLENVFRITRLRLDKLLEQS
ncbi:MAG: 2-oxo-4-hydroxy-4-carboxy-5-ureidoimidazoline decarboxylase [Rhodomicrobium sp.]